MGLNRTLRIAKKGDEKKVGLNLQIPISLKEDFEKVCKSNNISMTAMVLAFIEDCVNTQDTYKDIEDDVKYLYERSHQMWNLHQEGVGYDEIGIDTYYEWKKTSDTLKNIQKLTRKGKLS